MSDKTLPPHDFVLVLKGGKTQTEKDICAIIELLVTLDRKEISYSILSSGEQLMVLISCQMRRLHKQYFKSRLNDWLKGVGNVDFDHKEELNVGKVDELSVAQRKRLIYDIITETGDHGGIDLFGNRPWEHLIVDVFCRHDEKFNKHWIKYWSSKWLLNMDDFTKIRDHFGEKIALYFGFLQYYFVWLSVPAFLSILVYISNNKFSPSFSVATTLWGVCFVEFWARREKDMATLWNTSGCGKTEKVRSSFRADRIITDSVTGEPIKYYSPFKRYLKLLITIPVVGMMVTSLLALIFLIFSCQMVLNEYYAGPFAQYVKFGPTIAYSIFIPKLDKFYQNVCKRLNEFENYRTEEDHEEQMAQKIFVSSFLSNFSSPLLYGLFFIPFGGAMADMVQPYIAVKPHKISPDVFQGEVAYFILTGQVINLLVEVVVPFVTRMAGDLIAAKKQHKPTASVFKEDNEYTKLQKESCLPEYDVNEDYAEMVMQFGYVVLFSSVYPITSLAAFINNFVELRSDAVKICINFKRPIPIRVENIGTWMTSMRFFTWLSVLTNVTWIFMYGSGSKVRINEWPRLLVEIFIWEHLFFLAAWFVHAATGIMPSWSHEENRKQDWNLKRKFISLLGDEEMDEDLAKSAENLGVDPLDPMLSRKSSVENIEHLEIMRMNARQAIEEALKIK